MESTFIIEHLEKEVWPWCKIEYENSAKLIAPWKLIISNIDNNEKISGKNIELNKQSVKDLAIDWKRVCVLDPKAEKVLEPSDKEKFDYFVFGGILGDEEFNGRTGVELTNSLPQDVSLRHIGKKQFSTDNALFVTKLILTGTKLSSIPMQWQFELEINDIESIILPYCYPLVNGKPQISDELVKYLKNKKGF